MREFDYYRATDIASAIERCHQPASRFLAGGTTQLDLMKCDVERPGQLVDIIHLNGMRDIHLNENTLHLGALVKMSHAADDAGIQSAAPALVQSLALAASAQLRNMATLGGNLLQRTRCPYFRDPHGYSACNKRQPGSGCAAMNGVNRNHAILGTSDSCIALYPGDFAVALSAFDAIVHLQDAENQQRQVAIDDFFRLPGDRPDIEHDLAPGELIVAIEIPLSDALKHSHYLKVRDRASYEFAAASAAVGIEFEADGHTLRDVRIALGGLATKPWRAREIEQALKGKTLDKTTVRQAAALITQDAVARQHNAYKMTLAPRVIARALLTAGDVV